MKKDFDWGGGVLDKTECGGGGVYNNKPENKSNTYNILYDAKKAEKLKAECDEKFLKRYKENVKRAKQRRGIYRKVSFAFLLLTLVFAVTLVLGVKNSSATIWVSIMALVVSVAVFILFVIFTSSCSGTINYEECHFERNQMEYAYPHLVCFHNLVSGREIVGVSYEKSPFSLHYLNVLLKNSVGVVETEKLLTYPKYSTNVEVTTYDAETGYTYFPFKKSGGDFVVSSGTDSQAVLVDRILQ